MPHAMLVCCAILGQPNRLFRRFNSTMTRTRLSEGPFGPGFAFFRDENNGDSCGLTECGETWREWQHNVFFAGTQSSLICKKVESFASVPRSFCRLCAFHKPVEAFLLFFVRCVVGLVGDSFRLLDPAAPHGLVEDDI